MDIFVYSDESGVFDRVHNNIFVFGGLIFLSKRAKDDASRKYIKAEKDIRSSGRYPVGAELKASLLTNEDKGKLFRSLNQHIKFGAIVEQKKLRKEIFDDKKNKQKNLDYTFKIALKRAFESLMRCNMITESNVDNIHVFSDEHATATNARYELRDGMEGEYKRGTINFTYNKFYPPIFTNLENVNLTFCDSNSVTLIRAADIVANRIYYLANKKLPIETTNLIITRFPEHPLYI